MKKEIQRLDNVAGNYNPEKDFDNVLIKYLLRQILENCKKKQNILEIGCSTGIMSNEFARNFNRLVIVEGSEKYVDYVKKKLKKFTNIEYNALLVEQFKTDELFDNIVISLVLEHVINPVSILKKIKNFLKKDGILHIIVPNSQSLHRRLGRAMGLIDKLDSLNTRDIELGHRRVYNKKMICSHIKKAGLKIIDIKGNFLKPLSNSQMLNWSPEQLEGLFNLGLELPELSSQLYCICKNRI